MHILFNESKLVPEICLGDLFKSTRTGSAFILIEYYLDGNPCVLINVQGYDSWSSYETLELAKEKLKKDVENGLLSHFSSKHWKLNLERK